MKFEVKQNKLKNGVRVVEIPMKGVDSVMAMVMVRTGSRNETDEQLGISHVLEHMLFKGTEKYPTPKEVASAVDEMGAEFNAFTSKEYTAYYIRSASQYLNKSLEVLGEMIVRPRLEAEALEREKGVIIEEINMYEDQPRERAEEEFENLMFEGSNLGRLIIGSRETVRGATAKSLRKYKESWYRGENVMVIVAGKVSPSLATNSHQTADGMTSQVYGSLPDLSSFEELPEGRVKKFVDEVRYGERREKVIEKGTEQTHFVVGVPGLAFNDKRRYAEAVLKVILGGNMSSRLFVEVREKRGLAYYVGAIGEHFFDGGYLGARAGVRKDKYEEALKVVKEQMMRMKTEVSEEEVEKAKSYLAGKVVLGLENPGGVVRWFGKELILGDKAEQPEEFLQKIKKVGVEEVMGLARELFREEEMRVAVVR